MKRTSLYDLQGWLTALAAGAQSGTLHCPSFLKPYHLVTLALMLKQKNARWLELSPEIESYALRMGLWEATNIIPPYEMIENAPTNKFLPVAPLENMADIMHVAKRLTSLVYEQNLAVESFTSVETMLMELIENTYKHARVQEELHGLVCAQSWPKGNLAQIVFADSGIGIRNSLNENPQLKPLLATHNPCQLACQLGITSKPEAHSGYGLALTRDLMQQSQGSMLILSGSEGFYAYNGKDRVFRAPLWPGTLIILEWPINQKLNVGAVYESWPVPEGFELDDFK